MIRIRTLSLAIVFLFGGTVCGQESLVRMLLNETEPSVYIRYDALFEDNKVVGGISGIEKKAETKVNLQLVNNTGGAIQISDQVFHLPPEARGLALSDGRNVKAIRDEGTIFPCYEVKENPYLERSAGNLGMGPNSDAILHNNWRFELPSYKELTVNASFDRDLAYCHHQHLDIWIAPGESAFFVVPREHLALNYILSIPFEYEWEKRTWGYGNGDHEVAFSGEELQKAMEESVIQDSISSTPSTLAGGSSAQKLSATDMLLDVDRPSVYIRYVEHQKTLKKRDNGETKYKLQLLNNTRKAIRIPTERLDSVQVNSRSLAHLILSDGSDVLAMHPGSRIYPCYMKKMKQELYYSSKGRDSKAEPESADNRRFPLPFTPDCALRSVFWIAPETSVFFIVPQNHMDSDYEFIIPFNYEWEKGIGDASHHIIFSADMLKFMRQ